MTQQILLIGLNVFWQITALALVALGLAIVFGLLRILNMAHGEFIMMGAYTGYIVQLYIIRLYLQII